MKKSDLKTGMYVIMRDSSENIILEWDKSIVNIKDGGYIQIDWLNDDLTCSENTQLDIMKVYEDYTLSNLLWKRKI